VGQAGACWSTLWVAVSVAPSANRGGTIPSLRGGTPERGGDLPPRTVSIKGGVIFSAVSAAVRGGTTTVKNRLKGAAAGASWVWPSMVGLGVVEEAEGA